MVKKTGKKSKGKKQQIPATVRNTVWNTYIGIEKGVGDCFCCKMEQISRANFHCGHVIAEINSGSNKVENLRPICAHCNSSMGTENMLEFMEKYGLGKSKVSEPDLIDYINIQNDISGVLDILKPIDVVDLMKEKITKEEEYVLRTNYIDEAINFIWINRIKELRPEISPFFQISNDDKCHLLLFINGNWVIDSVEKLITIEIKKLLERSLPTDYFTKISDDINKTKPIIRFDINKYLFLDALLKQFDTETDIFLAIKYTQSKFVKFPIKRRIMLN